MSNQKDEIYILLCKLDRIRIVPKKFLKECPYLENAIIFQRLFNLTENSPFQKYKMKKNDNNELTLLKDFYITAKEWDLIIHFLKYGFTLAYYGDSEYSRLKILEKTGHIFNILGGIPSFDQFYLRFQKNKEIEKNFYNPMYPCNDTKMRYEWMVLPCYDLKNHPDYLKWEVTQNADVERGGNNFYYRKLKKT